MAAIDGGGRGTSWSGSAARSTQPGTLLTPAAQPFSQPGRGHKDISPNLSVRRAFSGRFVVGCLYTRQLGAGYGGIPPKVSVSDLDIRKAGATQLRAVPAPSHRLLHRLDPPPLCRRSPLPVAVRLVGRTCLCEPPDEDQQAECHPHAEENCAARRDLPGL
jgi:hypothetical protein